ncbi:E3 ubiquitin-protein ligase RNF213-like [Apteryx rowi]|uniref:E3 ubiquitin-protein ligase RNF213-like n=1 Tax=Apteryx rowi TaxID=308060 RepID=UPI000E1D8189|nr:E3 ubiquitin-protein ligase RNF213-like [Apteryx rowi]
MDTSPTVQSSLLKLLLRCGFSNMKVHLEKYLSQMEEKMTSNQSNRDHFYFMVVHCLEGQGDLHGLPGRPPSQRRLRH